MTTCTYQGLQYANHLRPKRLNQVNVNYIINKVCERYGISTFEIASKSRKADLVEARTFAVNMIKETTDLTLVRIGRTFNRDHSTIIYLIQVHADLIAFDKRYKNKYNRLVEDIFNR